MHLSAGEKFAAEGLGDGMTYSELWKLHHHRQPHQRSPGEREEEKGTDGNGERERRPISSEK